MSMSKPGKRVEVLTGGASSVYGSDALAGVVNFILDEDFEGFKASYMHSSYQHSNDNSEFRDLVRSHDYQLADDDVTTGETDKLAAAFGGSIFDGRGHITGFIEKTDTSPILQGDYDISACALTGGTSACGGSSTIPPGRWWDFGRYADAGYVNSPSKGASRPSSAAVSSARTLVVPTATTRPPSDFALSIRSQRLAGTRSHSACSA